VNGVKWCVSAVIVLCLLSPVLAEEPLKLKDGDVVGFCGDSITSNGAPGR